MSSKLRQRFCKDSNAPIKIYSEPYFSERLNLISQFELANGVNADDTTLAKWEQFQDEIAKYPTEQDYFEDYNRVKDEAIRSIKGSLAFQQFNQIDMSVIRQNTIRDLPSHDIFKDSFVGKHFVSIDIIKANFSCLHHFDTRIFEGAHTWEDFLGQFTDMQHIIRSKYIRQVILGNCNAGRCIAYEKYIMSLFMGALLERYPSLLNDVRFFSNDEVIFEFDLEENWKGVQKLIDSFSVPLRTTAFQLGKVNGTNGYIKRFRNGSVEVKCLDPIAYPFALKKFLKEEPSENDGVFIHDGMKARLLDIPKIEFAFEKEGERNDRPSS